MNSYMFDTNIFNHILDGEIDFSLYIGKANFYATHIQHDEMLRTKDSFRRESLIKIFTKVLQDKVPTESFVLGVTRLDEGKLGGENIIPTESAVYGVSKYGLAKYTSNDNLCEPIKIELDKINKSKSNNIHDALIGETCLKNNLTLVTHDKDL